MEAGQNVIFTNDVAAAVNDIIAGMCPTSVIIICDSNTRIYAVDRLVPELAVPVAAILEVLPGDSNKNLDSLVKLWTGFQEAKADRKSLIINIGGGMITDMGGFAASTFKRGMRFVNVPTTLLSAVDAAVGGKTGINFRGLKNEIGVFNEADAVIISTCFFNTLPLEEIKSGYAEMLKHGLIKGDDEIKSLLAADVEGISGEMMLPLLERSVNIKRHIVAADPHERGLRKALNLGHTPGHAFESHAMNSGHPVPHGYAVAWGCVVDLVLSHIMHGFPSALLHDVARYVRDNYGSPDITCRDYDTLLGYMRHDKKNEGGHINFTLLASPGDLRLDSMPDDDMIRTSLDIFCDLMGI